MSLVSREIAQDVVIAGLFPAKTYRDGTWDVVGDSKVSRVINDYMLTTVLTSAHIIDRLSGGLLRFRVPVTPVKQSIMYRMMSALGVKV